MVLRKQNRRTWKEISKRQKRLGNQVNGNDSVMVALSVFGPNCPSFSIDVSSTPHWRGISSCCCLFRPSSSSSSSMEFPPEGYRRNVGICLFNPSGKVISLILPRLLLSLPSCFLLLMIIVFCPFNLLQIFAASRLNRPEVWEMPQVISIPTYFQLYSLGNRKAPSRCFIPCELGHIIYRFHL